MKTKPVGIVLLSVLLVFAMGSGGVRAAQDAAKPVSAPAADKAVATPSPAPVQVQAEKTAPMEAEWSNPLPPGRINLGIHFGDQQTESFGDFLAPIFTFKSGLMFINPRGSWNDSDGQEFNLGLGYRHLFPDKNMIAGVNAFYDLRNTSLDNTFNQFGFGVEFLSTWVDARANVYLPEGGKKTADLYSVADSTAQEHGSYWYAPTGQGNQITQYGYDVTSTYEVKTLQHFQITEQAMEGYDAEIGGLLPIPGVRNVADVKAFAGYYGYNAHYGKDISGMKARLEVKPLPSLYLDASWYEDEELMGSHYSVGVRASVPFDLANLSRGKNPFAGALDGFMPGSKKPAFASRMTEMVMRDLHIRTDASDPEELVSDRKMLEKTLTGTSRKDYNLVLASDVTFVDDDNRSGVEDGSWEHPYRQIQTGVLSAIGTMVYVRDAAQQYYENVVLRDGLTLWGSGAPIYGQGNRFLGGIYPVVNGLGRGPAITLANSVTVAGFEITQTPPAYPPQVKTLVSRPRIDMAGIYGENVTDVNIQQNYIHGSGATVAGIEIRNYSTPSFTANISNNRIDDVRGNGIDISLNNVEDVDLTLANNNVTRCDENGVAIYASGNSGTFMSRISGNYSENGGDGIYLSANNYDTAVAMFVDTAANQNDGYGINVQMHDNDLSGMLMASHADLDRIDQLLSTVLGSLPILPLDPGDGFSVADLLGVRELYREGGSMQANGNGHGGIYLYQTSYDVNLAGIIGAQVNGNDGSGIEINQYGSYGYPDVSVAAVARTQANGNDGPGMRVSSYGDDLALNVFMDVKANDNANCGIRSSTYSEDGVAGAVVLAADPILNLVQNISSSPLLGEYVDFMDMSFVPAFGQVEANRNEGSGIYINAHGDDAAFAVVLDAQANGNGLDPYRPGNGIQLELTSDDGPAIGIVGSTEALMALAGTLLDEAEIPLDLSHVQTLGPVQANDNRDNGVYISAYGEEAVVGVIGLEALRNGWGVSPEPVGAEVGNGLGGDGLYARVHAYDGDAVVGLGWINASDNGGDGIYASVESESYYGESMLGGVHITANNNMGSGLNLDIGSVADDSSYLVLGGVEANGNITGSGIDAWLHGDGSLWAALTGIQANENGSHGVWVETDSYDGDSHVWISDTAVQDMSDHGGGWDLMGLDLLPLVPAGDIEANDNGDNGIFIESDTTYADILVDVGSVTASGNGNHGVKADLYAWEGGIDAGFSDIVAEDNGNGLRVDAWSDWYYDVDLTVENVEATGSRNNGINANLTSWGMVDAAFMDNTAMENGDHGIRVEATSYSDNVYVEMEGNTAGDNEEDGIRALVSASDNAEVRFTGNVTSGNGEDGLHIKAEAGQQLKVFGQENVAKDNGDDGIDVKTSAASGSLNRQYDFGGGVLGSIGYNVMADNGDYDMERSGAGAFSAQYNYWDGWVPPWYGFEYVGNNMDVDYALALDPTLP